MLRQEQEEECKKKEVEQTIIVGSSQQLSTMSAPINPRTPLATLLSDSSSAMNVVENDIVSLGDYFVNKSQKVLLKKA